MLTRSTPFSIAAAAGSTMLVFGPTSCGNDEPSTPQPGGTPVQLIAADGTYVDLLAAQLELRR